MTSSPFEKIEEPEPIDWVRIASYVAGQGSPIERSAIERRAETDPEWRRQLMGVRKCWELCGEIARRAQARRAWGVISSKIRRT